MNLTTVDGGDGAISTRRPALDAEALLRELTTRQHVRPHRPLRAVLADTRACPVAAERAIEWLALDGGVAVGRVKRAELIQLARSLHRFWRRALAAEASASASSNDAAQPVSAPARFL